MAPATRRNQRSRGNGSAGKKTAESRQVVATKRSKAPARSGRASKRQRQSDDSTDTDESLELGEQGAASAWLNDSSSSPRPRLQVEPKPQNGALEVAEVLQGIQEHMEEVKEETIRSFEQELEKWSEDSTLSMMESLPMDIKSFVSQKPGRGTVSSDDMDNESYTQALESLKLADGLLEEYQSLSRSSIKMDKPEVEHWEQDVTELTSLNDAAKEISLDILRGMVMPKTKSKSSSMQGSDIYALAQELLAGTMPQKGEETWGSTAQALFKAFSGVVALLPEEK